MEIMLSIPRKRVKPPVAAFSRHIICFWLESFYKLFIVLVVTIR